MRALITFILKIVELHHNVYNSYNQLIDETFTFGRFCIKHYCHIREVFLKTHTFYEYFRIEYPLQQGWHQSNIKSSFFVPFQWRSLVLLQKFYLNVSYRRSLTVLPARQENDWYVNFASGSCFSEMASCKGSLQISRILIFSHHGCPPLWQDFCLKHWRNQGDLPPILYKKSLWPKRNFTYKG